MREIKFRAWDNWQFKYFDLDALEDRKVSISDENFNTVTNCIINQYTWLLDKNWKEIYEGDIIQYRPNRNNGEIKFLNWCFKVARQFPDPEKETHIVDGYHEVIWNIYENQNLLTNK